jgi:putative ABC transport system substrate-binding protein
MIYRNEFFGGEESMSIKRKVSCIAVLTVLAFLVSVEAQAEKKIGILMFSEETRYLSASQGFRAKMKEEGFGEPHVKFLVESAGGNKARTVELVRKLAAEKLDLIFTLGTSATTAVVSEIKDVPIVFSIVYDPVVSGIARDWKSSGNNTTGISSNIPMPRLMDILTQFKSVQKMAVLYTPGEKNSESQLRDLQEIQANFKIRIVPVPFSKKEDIALILPSVIRTIDALYITGSNLVDSQILAIVAMATRARVLTITHLEDLVEKGVLLGLCSDSYTSGRMAGEKAVRILKGAKPSSISIEPLKEYKLLLNLKTSQEGRFQIPEELMRTASRIIR